MAEVSICLTTYNRAAVLSQTIDSILNQTFQDFELIISDDNSSDETKVLCESYLRRDSRVRYFRNPENLKMPGNLNNAIRHSNAPFVANLHDGDIYRSDLIEKWYDALVRHPDALFVFNGYEIIDNRNNRTHFFHKGFDSINDGRKLMDYFLNTFTSAPWGTVMTRKSAYDTYGLFDSYYGFISDVEMWLRLGLHGKVAYIEEPLIQLTPREKEHTYYYPHWNVIRNNFKILKKYYKQFGYLHSDIKKLNKKIAYSILRDYLILLKYNQNQRLKEGEIIFKQSPFLIHRLIAMLPLFSGKKSSISLHEGFWDEVLLN